MVKAETSRILIRTILPKDIDAILNIYNKGENMRFISNGKFNWTRKELLDKYEKTNLQYKNGTGIFAIELKATRQIIGEGGLFNSFNDVNKLELGYIIDSEFWRKGYGNEVCVALINYAFSILKVKTLIARMYTQNIGSVKLSEKIGMRLTDKGTTKEGKDFLVYQICSEE